MSADLTHNQPSVEAPPSGGASHFGEPAWAKLCSFATMLENEGDMRGLLGPRELERLWSRHLLNSLAIEPDISASASVADIGSGAGFPGIVLAIVRPDLSISLIETMDRRVQWLEEVVKKLDLPHVQVFNMRAEELAGQAHFDVVTARAVAPLKKLIPWAFPLLKPTGALVALKGARAEIEIDEARKMIRKFSINSVKIHERSVWGTDEATRVVKAYAL